MKAIRKYLVTLLIGFLAAGLIAWSRGVLEQTAAVGVFHVLCDAFFVVGVVMSGVGLLIFSSNEGTFDMIVYGVKSFMGMFRKNMTKKYDTFYDYRESRAEKKVQFGFLVICGLFFLAISFVMYYLYSQYK